jgi:hypothetical protein
MGLWSDALIWMEDGEKVRHSSWPPRFYITGQAWWEDTGLQTWSGQIRHVTVDWHHAPGCNSRCISQGTGWSVVS